MDDLQLQPPCFGVEDGARINDEIERVWKAWHQRMHPTMKLADALRHEALGRVLRAHALANIRHGLDRAEEVPHAA